MLFVEEALAPHASLPHVEAESVLPPVGQGL